MGGIRHTLPNCLGFSLRFSLAALVFAPTQQNQKPLPAQNTAVAIPFTQFPKPVKLSASNLFSSWSAASNTNHFSAAHHYLLSVSDCFVFTVFSATLFFPPSDATPPFSLSASLKLNFFACLAKPCFFSIIGLNEAGLLTSGGARRLLAPASG
ncbi:MAG: hypothetical protein GYA40_05205 [Chloroflexi bacterium]|nr:hypothetical protein [Chloroflexota bacterium]